MAQVPPCAALIAPLNMPAANNPTVSLMAVPWFADGF
jgi:hypothetical protein